MRPLSIVLVASILALAAARPAASADTSDHDIIGFSRDGRWLAYREFGVQDGSGFPFARLFVLDTNTDGWANGTPVRVTREDERATVVDALDELHRKTRKIIDGLGIRFPAETLAAVPIRQQNEPVKSVEFKMGYPYGPSWTLRVETVKMADRSDCFGLGDAVGLKLVAESADAGTKTLYADERLPQSRRCPLDYAFAQLIAAPGNRPDDQAGIYVALVYVFSPGFEGRDVTLMAVPVRLGE